MQIGILAVQGAFAEQEQMLKRLGVACFEIRERKDLAQQMDGLILPGGESTVMGKLLRELGLFTSLKDKIEAGLPVLGTCAGLILLAEKLSNDEKVHFGTLPVLVQRNAYGRQLGSFYAEETVQGIGTFPMTFIRAPFIEACLGKAEVLAEVEDRIVAVRYKNQIGLSFHPELTVDTRLHQYFLNMITS